MKNNFFFVQFENKISWKQTQNNSFFKMDHFYSLFMYNFLIFSLIKTSIFFLWSILGCFGHTWSKNRDFKPKHFFWNSVLSGVWISSFLLQRRQLAWAKVNNHGLFLECWADNLEKVSWLLDLRPSVRSRWRRTVLFREKNRFLIQRFMILKQMGIKIPARWRPFLPGFWFPARWRPFCRDFFSHNLLHIKDDQDNAQAHPERPIEIGVCPEKNHYLSVIKISNMLIHV